MDDWRLSTTLHGHAQDVRTLAVAPAPLIISGSRDASAIVWSSQPDGKSWAPQRTIKNPDSKFVSSVAWLEAGGRSYIVLGSQSSTVTLWDVGDTEAAGPSATLLGHKLNVCCLDADNSSGTLISGSWDKTAIVWKDQKKVIQLARHEQAVWAVKCIGGDRFLTGSADKSIKLFDVYGNVLQTYSGHTDCVRSIALRTDGVEGFWSAGNDSKIMQWTLEKPTPVAQLAGSAHSSFIYSVTALPRGRGLVSSGEDGTFVVWRDGKVAKSIIHPTASIWSSAVLPNGDIVSAASDAQIRIWTADESRAANAEERQQFDQAVSERQISKSLLGNVNEVDLPGMEALGKPGKHEGEIVTIKDKGTIQQYQWQASQSTWQQIGNVVNSVGSGQKQMYEGKEYDYVFEVDISEGAPPLKLPYNASESPYKAAERFLNKHELPLSYTSQVVAFIEKNTVGMSLGQSGYSDPYTGGSRYQASSSSNTGATYRDPFTGGGAYSSTPAPAPSRKSILPLKTPQLFKQIKVSAVQDKVKELNSALKADPTQALSEAEEQNLDAIYKSLSAADGASATFDAALFCSTMCKWPEASRFPLIDLCRALISTNSAISSSEANVISHLLQACSWETPWQASKARETNTMLAMRGIANLAATKGGRDLLTTGRTDELLQDLAGRHSFDGFNKNIRVALATIALNISTLAADGSLPKQNGEALLQYISNILSSEPSDGEVAYRALVAFGNILATPSFAGGLNVGDVEVAKEMASALADKIAEPRLKEMMAEINAI